MQIWEIAPNLYQSPTPRSPEDARFEDQDGRSVDVDALIDLEGKVDPNVNQEELGELYLYWPIEDGDMPDEQFVRSLAKFLSGLLDAGYRVLVHCNRGLNRASLVTGRTLIERGMDPQEVVELLRERRSPDVLHNPVFRDWLLSERSS